MIGRDKYGKFTNKQGDFSGRKIKKSCLFCGKEFFNFPCLEVGGKGKYCSRSCYHNSTKGKQPECLKNVCIKGAHLNKNPPFKKGHIPWNKGMLGIKNVLWKVNKVSTLKRWIRSSQIYLNWQKDILKRDNYTCQFCGKYGGKLEVDHYPLSFLEIVNKNNIKNFEEAFDIQELFDLNNGRVLCNQCHKLTPTYGGRNKGGGSHARI